MSEEFTGYEELQVVGSDSLNERSQQGWKLLQVLSEAAPIPLDRVSVRWPEHGGCAEQHMFVEEAVGVQTQYLMGLKRDTVIDNIRKELNGAKINLGQIVQKHKDAERERADAQGKLVDATDRAANAETRMADLQERLEVSQELTRQMEKDVAKVRERVGADRMKEILDAG